MPGIGHWYVEIQKQAYWRGVNKTWMNRYVLSGADPVASDAESVISALHDIENKVYPGVSAGNGVGFVKGTAYASGGGAPFAEVTYNPSLSPASATGFTGGHTYTDLAFNGTLENALGVRIPMNGLSSRGKPVYCRKYFRGITGAAGSLGGAVNGDPLDSADLAYINTTVLPWQTGMASNNWVVIGNSGRQASSAPQAEQFLVNRQVPRGKKRKSTTGATTPSGLLSELVSATSDAKKILSLLPLGE